MEWNRKDKKLQIILPLHICSCILLTTYPYVCVCFLLNIIFNFQIYSRVVVIREYLKTSFCYAQHNANCKEIPMQIYHFYQEQKYNWSAEHNSIFLKKRKISAKNRICITNLVQWYNHIITIRQNSTK